MCDTNAPAVRLNWGVSSGATSYDLYRNGTLYSSGIGGTTYYNSANLTAGQSYTYFVQAKNSSGATNSNTISVSIPANICATGPGSFTLSNDAPLCDAQQAAVRLNWSVSSGATSYDLYRNGTLYSSGIGGTTYYNSANLTAGQSYTYFVQAKNSSGATNSNTISVSIPANICGTGPGSFTLSNDSPVCDTNAPAVRLNWSVSSGATSYDLYRNGTLYSSGIGGTTYYNSANLTAGQSYTYFVQAKNSSGATNSNTITVSIPANICASGPGSFTVSNDAPVCDTNAPAVRLNWSVSSGATSYDLYRNGTLYSSGIGGTTYYNSANLTAGQSYTYFVQAKNSSGATNSNTISVTIPANICGTGPGSFTLSNNAPVCDTNAPVGPAVRLNWSASSGATSYDVYRNGTAIFTGITGTTFYNSAGLTAGQSYTYFVQAKNSLGATNSNTISVAIPANICQTGPGTLTVSNDAPVCDTQQPAVRLNWSASIGATSYDLYRNGAVYATGITGTTFYNSANLTAGQSYTYFVQAKNSSGTTNSNTISVAIPANICGGSPGALTLSNNAPVCDTNAPAVRLNWSVSSGATSYDLYRNGTLYSSGIGGTTYYNSANLTAGQSYTYFVQAKNSFGATNSNTISVTIPANICGGLPVTLTIATTALNPPTATVGVGYAAQQAVTATGGQPPYNWVASGLPNGMAINATSGAVFGTPTTAGAFTFVVTVFDSGSPQQSASKVLSITVSGTTSTLTITTTSLNPRTATVGVGYAAQQAVTATGGQPPYNWVASGLPNGMAINATSGAVFGTPTVAGTFNFTVTVFDSGSPQQSASKGLSITVSAGSSTLTITTTSLNPPTATVGVGYAAQQAVAATGGQTPYTWSASGLPNGMAINATTGAVFGTPTVAGTFGFTVTVHDSGSPQQSASRGLSIAVVGATTSLSITTTSLNPATATVGVGYAAQQAVTATGGQTPYTWSASGLPSGMGINSSTGAVFGTPTVAGTFNFTVTVQDSGSPQQTASKMLSITVTGAASTLSITTTSLNPATATVGVGYAAQQAVTATGGQTPYTWSASGLPGGMGINASTGAVFGTPTVAGTFNVTVTVRDSGSPQQTASKVLSLFCGSAQPTCALNCSADVPGSAIIGAPLSFVASSSSKSCTGTVSQSWAFGDGKTGSGASVTHAYATAGVFNWTLTTSQGDSTCVRNGSVSVGTTGSGLPTIDYFRASHDQLAVGGTSDLTWSVRDASTITFDGLGNVAASSGTTVAPTSTTTYKLTATNNSGSQTATLIVRVDSILNVSIQADRITGTTPLTATFTILSSGGVPPYRYLWSFGDTSVQPTHTWTTATAEDVTCTVTDSHGTIQKSNTLRIVATPKIAGIQLEFFDLIPTNFVVVCPYCRIGASADGVTIVEVRATTTASGNVTFTFIEPVGHGSNGGLFPTADAIGTGVSSLTVRSRASGAQFVASSFYRVPEDFNGATEDEPERTLLFSAHLGDNGSVADIKNVEFVLRRPPVVFVHGIWPSSSPWSGFALASDLKTRKEDPAFSSWDGISSIKSGAAQLRHDFDLALYQRRMAGIAASSVDVVAHSMGGLITKQVAAGGYDGWRADDSTIVHKLLTIDTPHFGSALTDFVFAHRDDFWIKYGFLRHHPIDTGAADDLRITAAGANARALSTGNLRAHSIVGVASDDEPCDATDENQLPTLVGLLCGEIHKEAYNGIVQTSSWGCRLRLLTSARLDC